MNDELKKKLDAAQSTPEYAAEREDIEREDEVLAYACSPCKCGDSHERWEYLQKGVEHPECPDMVNCAGCGKLIGRGITYTIYPQSEYFCLNCFEKNDQAEARDE